ncbi:hypothetical protein CUW27_20735 [Salmonella enterica]|nr:hypothetical protein [Salmonella enterica]
MTYRKRKNTSQAQACAVCKGDRIEVCSGVVAAVTAIEVRPGYVVFIALGRRWRFSSYAPVTLHHFIGFN